MAVPRLFVDADLAVGASGFLSREQSKYVRSVLRLNSGNELILFSGTGIEARARLQTSASPTASWMVEQVSWPQREPRLRLTVGIAFLRAERTDFAIQKLTEIGVANIVLLAADRSVVSFDAALALNRRLERYRRIAREAAEQSERVTIPGIAAASSLQEFVERQETFALMERAETVPLADVPLQDELTIVVGAEGGWSEREAKLIAQKVTTMVSLGRLILRAETAAIVAAGTLIQRSWAQQGD
jgi:16S rRNA (uracil1498-N3)-methyltransferase